MWNKIFPSPSHPVGASCFYSKEHKSCWFLGYSVPADSELSLRCWDCLAWCTRMTQVEELRNTTDSFTMRKCKALRSLIENIADGHFEFNALAFIHTFWKYMLRKYQSTRKTGVVFWVNEVDLAKSPALQNPDQWPLASIQYSGGYDLPIYAVTSSWRAQYPG